MVYRGSVRNGVVVLEAGTPPLREGTVVHVEPLDESLRPMPGTADAILSSSARWQGTEEELNDLLRQLKEIGG